MEKESNKPEQGKAKRSKKQRKKSTQESLPNPFESEDYVKKLEARHAKLHHKLDLHADWTPHEPEPEPEKTEPAPPPPPPTVELNIEQEADSANTSSKQPKKLRKKSRQGPIPPPYDAKVYAKKLEVRHAKVVKRLRTDVHPDWYKLEPEPEPEKPEPAPPETEPAPPETQRTVEVSKEKAVALPNRIANVHSDPRMETETKRKSVVDPPKVKIETKKPAGEVIKSSVNLDYRKNNIPIRPVESHGIWDKLDIRPAERWFTTIRATTPAHFLDDAQPRKTGAIINKIPPKLKVIHLRKKTKERRKVLRLNFFRARKLFGLESKLTHGHYDFILQMRQRDRKQNSEEDAGRSISSGDTDASGHSWLRQYSDQDFIDDSEEPMRASTRIRASKVLFAAFASISYMMILTGRMPFAKRINKNTGITDITMRRTSFRFILFCFTSIVMQFVLVASAVSSFLMFNEYSNGMENDKLGLAASSNASNPPNSSVSAYLRLEILHLEKHGFMYVVIMACFFFTVVCDIYIMFRGDHVGFMISNCLNSCVSFKLDGSKWIWAASSVLHGMLLLTFLSKLIVYIQRYSSVEWELNALITMTTTRWISDLKNIRTNLDIFPSYAAIFFFIQLYTIHAAFLHVLQPVLIALLVNNIGNNWNFRLGIILKRIPATSSKLKRIKSRLSYEYMLKYHHVIRDLVRHYSMKSFGVIIIVFYCLMVFLITAALFRLGRLSGINFDKNSTSTIDIPRATQKLLNLDYVASDTDAIVNTSILLFFFLGGLILVNEILGNVGLTIAHGGFSHVRRHGLIGCETPRERRFVLSLYQLFSARNPLFISPLSLFHVDRRFLVVVLNSIMLVFTAMIQAGRPNALLTQEIYGLCDTGICVIGNVRVNDQGTAVGAYNDQTIKIIEEATTLRTITLPVLPSTAKPLPTRLPCPGPPITGPLAPVCEHFKPELVSYALPNFIPIEHFFKRCPGTDTVRQLIYEEKGGIYVPIPLPTDPIDCILFYYRIVHAKTIVNAFGKPVSLPRDDCGFPKDLLAVNQFTTQEGKHSKTDWVQDVVSMIWTVPEKSAASAVVRLKKTDTGASHGYRCFDQSMERSDAIPPIDPLPIIGIVTSPHPVSAKPYLQAVCGMPRYYALALCDEAKNPLAIGGIRTVFDAKIKALYDDSIRKHPISPPSAFDGNIGDTRSVLTAGYYPWCITETDYTLASSYTYEYTFLTTDKAARANQLGMSFIISVPGFPTPAVPASDYYFRQIPRFLFEDGTWKLLSLKANLKSVFLPYPINNIHTNKPHYVDCFGNFLDEHDDCGLLPFTITEQKIGGAAPSPAMHRYPTRPKKELVNYMDSTGSNRQVSCWKNQVSYMQCGGNNNNADFNNYVEKLCDTFDKYKRGTLNDFFGDE